MFNITLSLNMNMLPNSRISPESLLGERLLFTLRDDVVEKELSFYYREQDPNPVLVVLYVIMVLFSRSTFNLAK